LIRGGVAMDRWWNRRHRYRAARALRRPKLPGRRGGALALPAPRARAALRGCAPPRRPAPAPAARRGGGAAAGAPARRTRRAAVCPGRCAPVPPLATPLCAGVAFLCCFAFRHWGVRASTGDERGERIWEVPSTLQRGARRQRQRRAARAVTQSQRASGAVQLQRGGRARGAAGVTAASAPPGPPPRHRLPPKTRLCPPAQTCRLRGRYARGGGAVGARLAPRRRASAPVPCSASPPPAELALPAPSPPPAPATPSFL
jgi:hypothetical protein